MRRSGTGIRAGLVLALSFATGAGAADLEAGKAKAGEICVACHGANGVSVSDTIPNLAGQRAAYLENQLKAFREGTRKADRKSTRLNSSH